MKPLLSAALVLLTGALWLGYPVLLAERLAGRWHCAVDIDGKPVDIWMELGALSPLANSGAASIEVHRQNRIVNRLVGTYSLMTALHAQGETRLILFSTPDDQGTPESRVFVLAGVWWSRFTLQAVNGARFRFKQEW